MAHPWGINNLVLKILLAVLTVVAVFAVVVATRPSTYHVERSVLVNAPPAVPYAVVSDFHRFGGWSPWEHLDPAMKKAYEGPATGAGSVYHWEGNKDVGAGTMTILESEAPQRVLMSVEFLRPFPSKAKATYSFKPEGAGSRVTWALDSEANFMVKGMQMFNLMDSMLGKDFESGLGRLKQMSESPTNVVAAP